MNSTIKKIITDLKKAKAEVTRLETLRDGVMAYERGAKRKKKAVKGK
jgi:hypothetical protein